MENGYERAAREVVPAVRYVLIKRLKNKYNMREEEIARHLGITQAATSKYVSGKRSTRIKRTAGKIDTDIIEKYTESIKDDGEHAVKMCLCAVCNTLNDFGCRFSYFKNCGAEGAQC